MRFFASKNHISLWYISVSHFSPFSLVNATLGSLRTRRRTLKKLYGSDTQLPYSVQKDGNDLLERIITSAKSWIHFYWPERKSENIIWKKEEEAPQKFKNEWSTWQMMLITFWDCCGLVYSEFGQISPKNLILIF